MKKYFLGVITGFIVCTMLVSAVAIANSPIKLIVNGNVVESDVPPQIIGGRTMVPARPLAEALGAKVEWDEENYAVVVTGGVQAGAVPTDLEPVGEQGVEKTRKMDARDNNPPGNASWLEGFRINGNRIETRSTIDTPGIHAMGFVTPDNFYLEESILNNVLSDMGLSTIQHRYPSPDIWFNAWYFISLKDIPELSFSYDDRSMGLTISKKSASQPVSLTENEEEFALSD
ncbi:MAG: copper amine oxidase N-terminal domain-containing protein [Peptococcia bacterium]|jgi:hypothetical protein